MIRHIFADFDGTLMNSKGHLTKTTAGAVRASHIPFTLISGRSPVVLDKFVQRLNLRTMQVAYNGACIFKPTTTGRNRIISECLIDGLVGAALVSAIKAQYPHISINLYDFKHRYNDCDDERNQFERQVSGQEAKIFPISQVFNQNEFKLFQISLVAFDANELVNVKRFIERIEVPGIAVHQYGPARIVITNQDARWERSINYIMMSEQLYTDEIAGFGDDKSDLSLLRMVGLPIVTAGAGDIVKKMAHYVVPDSDDNGLAQALRTLPELSL
jgi:HAD superfamily hydrolase (TIGR01484 family)